MKKSASYRKTRIMVVIGTRPEAIKMAPIIHEFQARKKKCNMTIVNTAQHRELVDQVLAMYDIKPDIDLGVMEDNQSLVTLFTKTSKAFEKVFESEKPDVLLIEGDTSTVFVASLMAFYHKIDVAHVEAGLRTSDIYNPFPEEVNRRVTSVLSKIHFAPTKWAKNNLLKEGYSEETIFVTGNPVIDSLLRALEVEHHFQQGVLDGLDFGSHRVMLVTAHRRENHGKPLVNICKAILELAAIHKNLVFVYPVHPNPNVKATVEKHLSGKERVVLVDPLDYITFVHLMKKSFLILTDSGGIQEEAPTVGTPVLVLREATERPEAVEAGTAKVIGTQKQRIVGEVTSLVNDADRYNKMIVAENPFGDGQAARRIADLILRRY